MYHPLYYRVESSPNRSGVNVILFFRLYTVRSAVDRRGVRTRTDAKSLAVLPCTTGRTRVGRTAGGQGERRRKRLVVRVVAYTRR